MKIKFIKPFRFIGNDPDYGSDITVPVGYKVDLKNDESAQWIIDNGFAEEVKESGWWRPSGGDRYYFIDDSGYTKCAKWQDDFWEVDRYRMGNVFKTEEAAERYRDYLKAIATVRQDEGVLTPVQLRVKEANEKDVHCIGSLDSGTLRVGTIDLHGYDIIANTVFFNTFVDAQTSLDKHLGEWKIIANYDWSRE